MNARGQGHAPLGRELFSPALPFLGQVAFDAFGRTVAQRYPTTEPKATNTSFNPVADTVAATLMEYDVLDRNTRTTNPDGTFTTIAYRFGAGRFTPDMQFETIVTDANVNALLKGAVKHTFRDVRELITSVKVSCPTVRRVNFESRTPFFSDLQAANNGSRHVGSGNSVLFSDFSP